MTMILHNCNVTIVVLLGDFNILPLYHNNSHNCTQRNYPKNSVNLESVWPVSLRWKAYRV